MKKVFLFLLSMIFVEVSMASSSGKPVNDLFLDLVNMLVDTSFNESDAQGILDEIRQKNEGLILEKKHLGRMNRTLVDFIFMTQSNDEDFSAREFLYKNKQYFTNHSDQQILNAYQKQKESRVAQKPLEALGSPMSKKPQLSVTEHLDSQSVNRLNISSTKERISPNSEKSRIKNRGSPTRRRGSVDSSVRASEGAGDTKTSEEKTLSFSKLGNAPASSSSEKSSLSKLVAAPSATSRLVSIDKPELKREDSLLGKIGNYFFPPKADPVSTPAPVSAPVAPVTEEKREEEIPEIESLEFDPKLSAFLGAMASQGKIPVSVVKPEQNAKATSTPISKPSSAPKPSPSASLTPKSTPSSASLSKPTATSVLSVGGAVDSSSNTKASVAQPAPSSASASSTPSPFVSTVDSLSTTATARERFGAKGKDREVASERRDEPRLETHRRSGSVGPARGTAASTASGVKLPPVDPPKTSLKKAKEEAAENELMSGAFNALSKSFQYKKPLNQENFEKAVAEMRKCVEFTLKKLNK
jgi:hypothetical protein